MAYLYRKTRSPFWYVIYRDAEGKELHRSTGLRADDPKDTLKAKALRAELEAKEHHRAPLVNLDNGWDAWVDKYLERHCETASTLRRYRGNWEWLATWLLAERVHSPRTLTYGKALEYLEWRTGYKKKSGKRVGRNTAIMELKLLAMVMGEAVRMGKADSNPLAVLRIKKTKAPRKPEMTDEEIREIKAALPGEPEWMQIAFEIALHTGCRLRETRIPIDCLDFTPGKERITFPSPKGGDQRAFSIGMPSSLISTLHGLAGEGRSFTLELPFQPSRRWQQFFIKIGKPHLCFHCLRVTFVTRLWRAGVPRHVAMRLVNHSSELVHRIYQRETVDDIAGWKDAVTYRT